MAGHANLVKPGPQWVPTLACMLLLAAKFWLVPRLNINWDEFNFLSLIHEAGRGELTQGLQNAHVHLFGWMPGLGIDEIAQINLGRTLMVVLLGISALLAARIAACWFTPESAWIAALALLATWPALKHGGSFRADSLLLPLQLGAILLLVSPGGGDRARGLAAGALLGAATVLSIKTTLLAPVIAVICLADPRGWRQGLRRSAFLVAGATATAGVLLAAHLAWLGGSKAGSTGAAAGGAWRTVIADARWIPQRSTWQEMWREDTLLWLVAAAGLVSTLWTRNWRAAACALALLPVLFYRNTFSYFYVVMWGPACVLVAAACSAAQTFIASRANHRIATTAPVLLSALLCWHAIDPVAYLAMPRQAEQRDLVATVHAMFPQPVAYLDHSGMIATFPKANFFMTSWAVERYRLKQQPFMPRALREQRPPLLLANRGEMRPAGHMGLLPEDRELIECCYQPYWGAIYIAGAAADIGTTPVELRLPFAGRYRIESTLPVRVAGILVSPGGTVDIADDRLQVPVEIPGLPPGAGAQRVRLLWAQAGMPPDHSPAEASRLYDRL
jgi:hypothetical protein